MKNLKEGKNMCTAISVTTGDNYFGRNLDYEYDFGEKIIITPRNYRVEFRNMGAADSHYAIIGMGVCEKNYPLYFDATNERGLSIAGLNFPGNAVYTEKKINKDNVTSFEVIPWILSQCATVDDAKKHLSNINITNDAFKENMKPSPLHWLIADKKKAVTMEQTKEGLFIYDNPVGVLTNNPEFDMQMWNLTNFMSLSTKEAKNNFAPETELKPYARGMGAIGLPGDFSSASRFVKACFLKLNSIVGETESDKVNYFFRMLYSVYNLKGSVDTGNGMEITNYSSCCNTDRGIYYYTTYDNSGINAVALFEENLESTSLICYEIDREQKIRIVNSK